LEVIMLSRIATPSRLLLAAISLSALGGLFILITLFSVMPSASRFDPLAHAARASAVTAVQTTGAGPRAALRDEHFFDYTFVFPEQPDPATP
jgi:hypothetical protein